MPKLSLKDLTPSFCAIVLATASCGALAGEGEFHTQIWINPGIYSIHFDRDKNLRDNNIGLGAEARFANDHGAMAGTFINGSRVRSNYAV